MIKRCRDTRRIEDADVQFERAVREDPLPHWLLGDRHRWLDQHAHTSCPISSSYSPCERTDGQRPLSVSFFSISSSWRTATGHREHFL